MCGCVLSIILISLSSFYLSILFLILSFPFPSLCSFSFLLFPSFPTFFTCIFLLFASLFSCYLPSLFVPCSLSFNYLPLPSSSSFIISLVITMLLSLLLPFFSFSLPFPSFFFFGSHPFLPFSLSPFYQLFLFCPFLQSSCFLLYLLSLLSPFPSHLFSCLFSLPPLFSYVLDFFPFVFLLVSTAFPVSIPLSPLSCLLFLVSPSFSLPLPPLSPPLSPSLLLLSPFAPLPLLFFTIFLVYCPFLVLLLSPLSFALPLVHCLFSTLSCLTRVLPVSISLPLSSYPTFFISLFPSS